MHPQKMKLLALAVVVLVAVWCVVFNASSSSCAVLAQEQIDIKRYNIEPGSLSVSGISAGGFMAVQFQVAFSKSVKGSGIVAGGPYDVSVCVCCNCCLNFNEFCENLFM